MKTPTSFPVLLQSFFTERLIRQRQASPHTIASYRDCFRLLLSFAKRRLHKNPSDLDLNALDAPFLADFLRHLESERKNSARTRNARLAALETSIRHNPGVGMIVEAVNPGAGWPHDGFQIRIDLFCGYILDAIFVVGFGIRLVPAVRASVAGVGGPT